MDIEKLKKNNMRWDEKKLATYKDIRDQLREENPDEEVDWEFIPYFLHIYDNFRWDRDDLVNRKRISYLFNISEKLVDEIELLMG